MKRLDRFWPLLALLGVIGCDRNQAAIPANRGESTAARSEFQLAAVGDVAPDSKDSRAFEFHYRFTLSNLPVGKTVRIWLPVPTSNSHQQVTALPAELPGRPTFHTEAKYGNRILHLEPKVPESGQLRFNAAYRIERREIRALEQPDIPRTTRELSKRKRALFLQANRQVPIEGKPLELLAGVDLRGGESDRAKKIYEVVDKHVTYKKVGQGWGNGDVLWVCDSRYGNCTDFHSLFISLARSQGFPSRFEIGFPIPSETKQGPVGGYHCWAFFFTSRQGWVPVDISEADKHPSMKDYYFGNLTPDRVTFSVGRDIELVPKSASGPLNYFIYPHVEVDDTPLPREQIRLAFSFADIAK